MFDYTKAALSKTVSDIKKISFYSHILFYLGGIVISVYNIFMTKGFLPVHIASLCLSISLMTIYIIYRDTDDKKEKKAFKAKKKKVKKAVKALSRIYIIACTVYAISFTASEVSIISILLAVFAVIMLIITAVFELIKWVIEKRVNMLINAVKEDADLANPINRVGGFLRRVKREETTRKSHLSENDKIILDDYIEEQYTSKK